MNKKSFLFCNLFRYHNILHSTKALAIPHIKCDNQVFNGVIKQENIDAQVFNGVIKQENIDAQVFSGIIKQENIDNQVFNRKIKEEIIDERDHHNDSQLQKGYELNLHHSIILISIDFFF